MSDRIRKALPKAGKTRVQTSCPNLKCACGQRPCLGDGVLDRLAPEEQEILILSSFYGLAKDEIAGIVGASVSAVEHVLARAVEHLRRLLPPAMPGPMAA
jgi:hypothetical protein